MTCSNCGQEASWLYMCDQDEDEQQLCLGCYERTDCGQGLHDESCRTAISEWRRTE